MRNDDNSPSSQKLVVVGSQEDVTVGVLVEKAKNAEDAMSAIEAINQIFKMSLSRDTLINVLTEVKIYGPPTKAENEAAGMSLDKTLAFLCWLKEEEIKSTKSWNLALQSAIVKAIEPICPLVTTKAENKAAGMSLDKTLAFLCQLKEELVKSGSEKYWNFALQNAIGGAIKSIYELLPAKAEEEAKREVSNGVPPNLVANRLEQRAAEAGQAGNTYKEALLLVAVKAVRSLYDTSQTSSSSTSSSSSSSSSSGSVDEL